MVFSNLISKLKRARIFVVLFWLLFVGVAVILVLGLSKELPYILYNIDEQAKINRV